VEFATNEAAKTAFLKMNGKELQGRNLKVDFDVKGKQKSSYKINLTDDKNRLYNKEPIKLEKSKHIKKDREKKKMEMIKSKH
jgi:RNA recognition motif-containing protein